MTNVCSWASKDASDPGSEPSSRKTNLFRLTHIIKCMSKILLTLPLFFLHAAADLWTLPALCCSSIIYFLCLGITKLSQLNIWSLQKTVKRICPSKYQQIFPNNGGKYPATSRRHSISTSKSQSVWSEENSKGACAQYFAQLWGMTFRYVWTPASNIRETVP